jgi:hypothetical protein
VSAENDKDRVADGGGEGGENGDKSGVGWIREGKVEPRVSDGVIGSFKEEADELATVLNGGKEREE